MCRRITNEFHDTFESVAVYPGVEASRMDRNQGKGWPDGESPVRKLRTGSSRVPLLREGPWRDRIVAQRPFDRLFEAGERSDMSENESPAEKSTVEKVLRGLKQLLHA